jgi:hypothetical protein
MARLPQRAGHLRRRAGHDLAVRRVHPAGDPIVKPIAIAIALALTAGLLADTSRLQLPTDRKA